MKNKKRIKNNLNEILPFLFILLLLLLFFNPNLSITGFATFSHSTSSEWTGTYNQTNSSTLTTSIILDNDTATTHYTSGTYTSQILNANSSSIWNNLNWSNTTSIGEIKFQIKSCDDSTCSGEIFVGPDNTSSTYFTQNTTLNSTLTPNNQYFQYKAFFSTTDTSLTPYLNNININYNSIPINPTPIVNSTAPDQQNYTNETLTCNFLCNDTNTEDTLTYDIYWYNNGTYNLSFLSQSCSNPEYISFNLTSGNTSKTEPWSCSINITDNSEANTSTIFSNNITINNYPPFNYSLSSPTNNSYTTDTTITFTINNGNDIDNDPLTYYLEVWNDSSLTEIGYINNSISETSTSTADTSSNLEDNTYYWRVLANDGTTNGSWSENRTFTVDTTTPSSFNLSYPTNNTSSTDTTPILNWTNSNDTNLDNYTIEISNSSGFTTINSTYSSTTNSFSNWTTPLSVGSWYWRVKAYDKASNSKMSNQYFNYTVEAAQTITETITTTSETTGGATKKPFNINIITPDDITIYSNDSLTIPLIVTNPSNVNFRTILLNVSSNTTDIIANLDISQIPTLRPKEQRKINLKLTTHTLPGVYGITITASVINPSFTDSTRIYANLIERDATTIKGISQQLDFAKKLFEGNPKCLDLYEFIKQAELSLQQKKYDQALNLAKNAISSCNKLLSLEKKEKLPSILEKIIFFKKIKENKTAKIISIEILSLLILIIVLIKHFRKKPKIENKKF